MSLFNQSIFICTFSLSLTGWFDTRKNLNYFIPVEDWLWQLRLKLFTSAYVYYLLNSGFVTLGNLSTRLFCDGDGDRKSLFVPVGVLELSVKSPSFRANVRTFILALSLEREYFSFTFWSCYLCRIIFFHVVQIVYSNINKNTDIFISCSFEQKMSAPASDGSHGKPK